MNPQDPQFKGFSILLKHVEPPEQTSSKRVFTERLKSTITHIDCDCVIQYRIFNETRLILE